MMTWDYDNPRQGLARLVRVLQAQGYVVEPWLSTPERIVVSRNGVWFEVGVRPEPEFMREMREAVRGD